MASGALIECTRSARHPTHQPVSAKEVNISNLFTQREFQTVNINDSELVE